MTSKTKAFRKAHLLLTEAATLLESALRMPPPDARRVTVAAQDAIIHALGALERQAFRYQPTDAVHPETGIRIYHQETLDETAANAYRHLHSVAGPIIDFEFPNSSDVTNLLPQLRGFVPSHWAEDLSGE